MWFGLSRLAAALHCAANDSSSSLISTHFGLSLYGSASQNSAPILSADRAHVHVVCQSHSLTIAQSFLQAYAAEEEQSFEDSASAVAFTAVRAVCFLFDSRAETAFVLNSGERLLALHGAASDDFLFVWNLTSSTPRELTFIREVALVSLTTASRRSGRLVVHSRALVPEHTLHSLRARALLDTLREHGSEDKLVVVVLVTEGYAHMFANFLCHLRSAPVRNILVVTDSALVALLAVSHGLGFLALPSASTSVTPSADFGSLAYQDLMLYRTLAVLDILALGFSPIIADVDAVWLDDPLHQVRLLSDFDVAVTDDGGEVCGCFVALRHTPSTLLFWRTVAHMHTQLLDQARSAGRLASFADSEQKILTSLIYDRAYNGSLRVHILSADLFPSGLRYFNERHLSAVLPVVVHNNFIIGKDLKINRFQRFGLWAHPTLSTSADDVCSARASELLTCYAARASGRIRAFKNTSIPALFLTSPAHNSLEPAARLIVQATTEAVPQPLAAGRVWVEQDPLRYAPFALHGVFDLPPLPPANTMRHVIASLDHSNIHTYATTSADGVFALDRDGKYHEEAIENVLKFRKSSSLKRVDGISDTYYDRATLADASNVSIVIKVLAFKRPESLRRLWLSLLAADYGGCDVPIEIVVDAARDSSEQPLVSQVIALASSLEWPFGAKTMRVHEVNQGIGGQWLSAWSPASARECAFVLEDDLVVSPLFFKWTRLAVLKYYDSLQEEAHAALVRSVELLVQGNTTSLDSYSRAYAGMPILYGICLQRQHLDPTRYPRKLRVENSDSLFLYSLIGTWGPLLLPSPWSAFILWWKHRRASGADPSIQGTIMNSFYRQNPSIWSPWMTRFAFETGLKCLYSNLPSGGSLVTSYRDAGENYGDTKGPSSALVVALDAASVAAMTSFPSMQLLAKWQYDFNLRRVSSMGFDRLCRHVSCDETGPTSEAFELNKLQTEGLAVLERDGMVGLSVAHWRLLEEMAEKHVKPVLPVFHTRVDPSLYFFPDNLHVLLNCTGNDFRISASISHSLGVTCAKEHGVAQLLVSTLEELQSAPSVLELLGHPDYLLLIGVCADSPTELTVDQECSDKQCASIVYSSVDDVCSLCSTDKGGVLFRL